MVETMATMNGVSSKKRLLDLVGKRPVQAVPTTVTQVVARDRFHTAE